MKNRIIVAVVMVLSAVLASIGSVIATVAITNNTTEYAKQLQSNGADAETLELFEEQWSKYEKILSCYIRHSEIEDISRSVEILKTIYNQDRELFEIECSRIISAAQHLKRTELPLLSNIL